MVPLLLNVLASEWLYLPPPLTEISGFHSSNFIMIVLIFSFFDLALDLVPPKFVIRRVLSMSEKCRLSFANPRFQFFRDPGTVSWVFLNYFSWKEGINSRSKFHHQQPELVFTILSIKNREPVLLGHPAPPRTPCTVTHIAWLSFLNNRFVFGWYHWSGQNGIIIRWCDFGRCDTLNSFGPGLAWTSIHSVRSLGGRKTQIEPRFLHSTTGLFGAFDRFLFNQVCPAHSAGIFTWKKWGVKL